MGSHNGSRDTVASLNGSIVPTDLEEDTGKETAWNWIRYLLIASLVISAVSVSAAVYLYTSSIETTTFQEQFESDAAKILNQVAVNFVETMSQADSFMYRVIHQSRIHDTQGSGHWPMITIPGLAVQAAKLIAQTHAIYMAFYPLIQQSQRLQWENFTKHNNDWVEEALQVQANNPHFKGPILKNYTKSNLIWNNEGPEPLNASGPFLPSWFGSPVIPYYYPYNWNALAYDAFAKGLLFSMNHRQVVVTPVANHANPNDPIALAQAAVTSDWSIPYLDPGEDPNEPFSDLYYPVLDTIDAVVVDTSSNSTALGNVAFSFYWRHVLKDILPDQSKGLILVVTNPCGQQEFTYQIDGSHPTFLEFGDKHEPKFHGKCARSQSLANLTIIHSSSYTGVPMSPDFCQFTLTVYPSTFMKDAYVTNVPIFLAVGSALIFLFVTALFCAYDFLIRREFYAKQRLLEVKRNLLRYVRQEVHRPLHEVCHSLSLLQQDMAKGDTQQYSNFLLDDEYVTQRTAALEENARTHLEGWLALTREISHSAGNSVDLLTDLLHYDQIQMGTLNLEWNILTAWKLIQQVAQEFFYSAGRKHVNLHLDNSQMIKAGERLEYFKIIGDHMKLSQLCRNLISNALKATPEDSSMSIRASWDPVQKHAMDKYTLHSGEEVAFPRYGTLSIEVTDMGPGMTEQELKNLFKNGEQINVQDLEGGDTSRLVIHNCKGVAKHHGGDLTASSEGLQKGATFTLLLPLYYMTDRENHLQDTSSLTMPMSTISFPTRPGSEAAEP